MVTKKPKGLGRGLEALLGPKVAEAQGDAGPGAASAQLPSTLLLADLVQIPLHLSLGVIVGTLAISILASTFVKGDKTCEGGKVKGE